MGGGVRETEVKPRILWCCVALSEQLSEYVATALVHIRHDTHMQRQPHGLQVIALQAVLPPCLGHQDGAVLSAVVLETEHIGA